MPAAGALTLGSTALGVGEGAYQLIDSVKKEKQDAAELSRLKDPFYKIQDEFIQDRNIAGNLAGQGLTSATKNDLKTNSERGLSSILANPTSPNEAAALYGTYNDSIRNNASLDAEAHLKNIDYFFNANKDLAGQKITQWSLNEYQPYERKLKELTERKAADETSAYNGANEIIGSVGAAGTALTNENLMKSLFGNKNGTKNDPFSSASDFQKFISSVDKGATTGATQGVSDGIHDSTKSIIDQLQNDPEAFLKLLAPNSPLFNMTNQPQ